MGLRTALSGRGLGAKKYVLHPKQRLRNAGMLRALCALSIGVGGLLVAANPAAASSGKPAISFAASPSTVVAGQIGTVTLYALVKNGTSCTLSSNKSVSGLPSTSECSDGTFEDHVLLPQNTGKKAIAYRFTLAATATKTAEKKLTVTVAPGGGGEEPLTAVKQVVNGVYSSCAVLTSGGVDCWGSGSDGELGNGTFGEGSATPVQVEGVGGTGLLSGVTALATSSDGAFGIENSFCALLISGEIDCWGYGDNGALGDGIYYTTGGDGSATPVQVVGVGGTGLFSGVTNITGSGNDPGGLFCAILTSGEVGCWGGDSLGNGSSAGSAAPVQVKGVSGTGLLTGVKALMLESSDPCALLTSGEVDCWGTIPMSFNDDDLPVQIVGVGGTGLLSGVASLTSGADASYCALLTSGGVDCWGDDTSGELGDGVFGTGDVGSATPTQVVGVGGTGLLSDVTSIASDADTFASYCAILGSGEVDCWGYGLEGELGNGNYYTTGNYGSATPVKVVGIGGSGLLSGVSSITASAEVNGTVPVCAILTSGETDCWGYGSAIPVQIVGVGGTGFLSGVTGLAIGGGGDSSEGGIDSTFVCASLSSGEVDCWGYGGVGELGDGYSYVFTSGSATPVSVVVALNNAPPPTTKVIIPSDGATLSGTSTILDATASNATSVEFWLLGGSYGYSGHLIGTATSTEYGWIYSWNTTTVPNSSYVLLSEASGSGGSAFSPGVSITVTN